jgi:hypothetical protein
VIGFKAPFAVVRRKADGVVGTLDFTNPRLLRVRGGTPMKIILDTGIATAVRFLTGLTAPDCKGVTWRDKDNSAHAPTKVNSVVVELSPAEERAVGSALASIRRSEAFRSGGGLSTDELREKLADYAEERRDAGRAGNTVDLDRRKVEYFLRWLDTGELPASTR